MVKLLSALSCMLLIDGLALASIESSSNWEGHPLQHNVAMLFQSWDPGFGIMQESCPFSEGSHAAPGHKAVKLISMLFQPYAN